MIIYTPSAGDVFRDALNALAMLTPSSTYSSLTQIMIIASVFAAMWVYVAKQDIKTFQQWFVQYFLIVAVLLGVKEPVEIIDMSNESKPYNVSNVPFGVALPAFFIGGAGYAITKGFAQVFHMPNDLDYNRSGMIFGSRIWTAATQTNFSSDADLSFDLTNYVTQCFFKSKMLVTRKISSGDLRDSKKLQNLLFKNPSKIYRIITHDGRNISCKDAAAELNQRVNAATMPALSKLALKLNAGTGADAGRILQKSHEYYTGSSQSAANILTQNMLINEIRHAQTNALAQTGSVGHLLNIANTASLQKMRMAEANDFWLGEYQLPQLMSSLWIMAICMFPLVALISLFPGCTKVYMYYIYSLSYLWLWPPLFVVIHFMVSSQASSTINLLTGGGEGGITLSNIDLVRSIHSDWALNAGRLINIVPLLAIGLVKGLTSVFNFASQSIMGLVQSTSMSEAQSLTQGNISMGNYSGWNANYDTLNAHKHDSNYTDYAGQQSIQDRETGNIHHISEGGNHSYTLGSSMTQSAVSVNGSHSLVDSLTKGKEQSLQEMDGYQASFTESTTGAATHASQFNETQGNNEVLGEGVSNSETANAQQALSRLWHKATDIADKTGMSVNEAFTGLTRAGIGGSVGVDTSKSIGGKLAGWAFGAKGEVHASTGGERSHSETSSHTTDSSYTVSAREAEDIRKDINTVSSYAKNHRYDASNSSSENHLVQTANDFRDAKTSTDGFNASLQRSQRASEALNHIESNSAALGFNLDSQAVKYGIDKVGEQRMTYLEGHHSDPKAFKELSDIKQEYINSVSEGILNNGIGNIQVDPGNAYSNAKASMHANSASIKAEYEAGAASHQQKAQNHGLGVKRQDKSMMVQKVNGKINGAQNQVNVEKRNQQSQFKVTEASTQNNIHQSKENINRHPVGKSLSDAFNAMKRKK